MKSITTKYLGPTNTKGSRIKATDGDNSVTIGCKDSIGFEENHQSAAIALCNKLGWSGRLYGGHTKDGMVWVFAVDMLSIDI